MPSSDDYAIWKKSFTEIHGELDTQRKINIAHIESKFHLSLGENKDCLFRFLFCLETYYTVILRTLAFKAVYPGRNYSVNIFKDETFRAKGITNYTCNAYYNWFLSLSDSNAYLTRLFSETELEYPDECDLISDAFESIFPKEVRHSMGEFYTPYWLADYVIKELTCNDSASPFRKYIDPACGSGTFLIALINRYKESSDGSIFKNICGIDINPLTVLAAKTNYLLQYCRHGSRELSEELEIPIYHADTISINDRCGELFGEDVTQYDEVPKLEYDYVVGNPPWVNWEYMPKAYRMKHKNLWQYYKLFSQKGMNATFIKEDISVLMTYVVIDNYLKTGGKLGFVVKETLFKSIKQGEGFRNFHIFPKQQDLKVERVEDLTLIKPFNGAVTRSAILYLTKGEKTVYPVDYIIWEPRPGAAKHGSTPNPISHIERIRLKAQPSDKEHLNSGWITESSEDMKYSSQILGKNQYTARTGVFTGGANGIFWLRIEEQTPSTVMVSNITDRAKNKMRNIHAEVEKDHIYPFLTGKELDFWHYSYSKYILCPHTAKTKMYPITPKELETIPRTQAYLYSFRKELAERKGFTAMDEQIHKAFYYTLQRIGEYTFSKYKVCWRYISKSFTPAVVEYANDEYLGEKNIIGNEKIISIGLDDRDEAYYLCGIISSTPYRKTIENFMVGTQITPSIIKRLNIPPFERNNPFQQEISRLCRTGHLVADKQPFIESIDDVIKAWLLR